MPLLLIQKPSLGVFLYTELCFNPSVSQKVWIIVDKWRVWWMFLEVKLEVCWSFDNVFKCISLSCTLSQSGSVVTSWCPLNVFVWFFFVSYVSTKKRLKTWNGCCDTVCKSFFVLHIHREKKKIPEFDVKCLTWKFRWILLLLLFRCALSVWVIFHPGHCCPGFELCVRLDMKFFHLLSTRLL